MYGIVEHLSGCGHSDRELFERVGVRWNCSSLVVESRGKDCRMDEQSGSLYLYRMREHELMTENRRKGLQGAAPMNLLRKAKDSKRDQKRQPLTRQAIGEKRCRSRPLSRLLSTRARLSETFGLTDRRYYPSTRTRVYKE